MPQEYTEAFAHFIIECQGAYEDLCQKIENGEVPSGTQATVRVTIPSSFVDEIRRERLTLMAHERTNGGGHG